MTAPTSAMAIPLNRELSTHLYLRQRLQDYFPNTDEDTLADTLEGMTNLREMLSEVIRSHLEDRSFGVALKARIADMQSRLARLEGRAEKKRDIVGSAMERADIRKIEEPDFTLSIRQLPRPLTVLDEKQIPVEFWIPKPPKLDRRKLTDTLRAGLKVQGATLGNGGTTIAVRTG